METTRNNDKDDRRFKIIIIIIIILLLLILLAGGMLFICMSKCCGGCTIENEPTRINRSLEVSNNTLSAQDPNLIQKVDDQYFELVGYGELEINEEQPYLNLINPSGNSVYLSFDVIYNDNVLYQTKLIEPGKMEQFDVYRLLDAGQHTITYSIDVYDLADQTPLWTDIQQEQEILID